MGNRVVVTLDKAPTKNSLGLYLHWNGGSESVLAFAEYAREVGLGSGDSCYGIAQLARIVGNFFGDNLSVGVGTLGALDCDNHDNGLIAVEWDESGVRMRQARRPKWEDGVLKGLETVDLERVGKHSYWVDEALLKSVRETNPRKKEV
jgi:hypothetical protein